MTRLVLIILALSAFIVAGILYAPQSKDQADKRPQSDTIVDQTRQPHTGLPSFFIGR